MLIKAGIMMLVFLFITIIAYFLLSAPVNLIFNAFDDIDTGEAVDEMNTIMPNIRTAFNIFFALLAAVPLTWFIFWSFSREPDWGYR